MPASPPFDYRFRRVQNLHSRSFAYVKFRRHRIGCRPPAAGACKRGKGGLMRGRRPAGQVTPQDQNRTRVDECQNADDPSAPSHRGNPTKSKHPWSQEQEDALDQRKVFDGRVPPKQQRPGAEDEEQNAADVCRPGCRRLRGVPKDERRDEEDHSQQRVNPVLPTHFSRHRNQPPSVVVANDVKRRLSHVLRTVLTSNEIRDQREVLLRVGRAHPAVDPWRAAEERKEFVHRQLLWHYVTTSFCEVQALMRPASSVRFDAASMLLAPSSLATSSGSSSNSAPVIKRKRPCWISNTTSMAAVGEGCCAMRSWYSNGRSVTSVLSSEYQDAG